MSLTFDATTYSACTEDEVLILGLADDGHEPGHYLLLQRAEHVDEQDRQLGMDTYHVELGGQEVSGYGGIRQVLLAPGRLSLDFCADVAWCREVPSLVIHWENGLVSVEALAAALGEIFLGTDTAIQRAPQ